MKHSGPLGQNLLSGFGLDPIAWAYYSGVYVKSNDGQTPVKNTSQLWTFQTSLQAERLERDTWGGNSGIPTTVTT